MEFYLISVFIVGYFFIAVEHQLKTSKAATALITGVLCWTVYIVSHPAKHVISHKLSMHLCEISEILFFLIGAMTIVEIIDTYDGFRVISDKIKTRKKRSLLWIIASITFALSPILDNLTATIVIISLLRKIIPKAEDRLFYAGITVIAANAGGAWSPLGDVTTTMLWIGGQISAVSIIKNLFLPSIICLLVPVIIVSLKLKGEIQDNVNASSLKDTDNARRNLVFIIGVASFLFVPLFKHFTQLPAFMGMLLSLGVIWIITELLHQKDEDLDRFSVTNIIAKIDMSSILFFLGILISIAALESAGVLKQLAAFLDRTIDNQTIVIMLVGLISSVVDNVPLVSAAQGMYGLEIYPKDHYFWNFLAYSTGTGGSALIIGSAAGIAAMGRENINFFWYVKNISWIALIGFFSGALAFILQTRIFES